MVVTKYVLNKDIKGKTGGKLEKLRIALVADLHNRPYMDVISAIRDAGPDMIAVAGDLMDGNYHHATQLKDQENAQAFLAAAATIAPIHWEITRQWLAALLIQSQPSRPTQYF